MIGSNVGAGVLQPIGGITGGGLGAITRRRYIDIPAGASYVNVPVHVMGDSVLEGVETASFTLAADRGYTLGRGKSAMVWLADNDSVRINFKTSNRFPPAGYAADLGFAFGDRAPGLTYG
jgi:hypothetical protein